MKKSTVIFSLVIIILLVLTIFIAKFAFSIGQHTASLTIKEATPKQLALAMQSDNFYGTYPQTMLLVEGQVKTIDKKQSAMVVEFETTSSPSALPKVTCDLENPEKNMKIGDTIRILTVAYDAQRKNGTDILLQNCYVLNK